MSQRLHIGETTDDTYDCVVIDDRDIYNKLLSEWLLYSNGMYLGPFKIRIENVILFKKIEPEIKRLFNNIGQNYPEDIWFIYKGKNSIEHPTEKELNDFISA